MLYRALAVSIAAVSLIACQTAYAAVDCWSAEEARAARLQSLNTLLMIEALKCEKTIPGMKANYEAFASRNHEAIVRSKHMIEDYFVVRGGVEAGRGDYLGYETALANEMSSPAANYSRCEDMVALAHLAAGADERDLPALANTLAASRLIEACPVALRPMSIDVWDRGPPQAYAAPPARLQAAGPPPGFAEANVEMVDGVPTDIPAAMVADAGPAVAPGSETAVLTEAVASAPEARAEVARTEVAAADPAAALQAAAHALALAADALKNASPRSPATAVN